MSAVTTRREISQRPSAGLHTSNFGDKSALQSNAFFDRGYGAQLDDHTINANLDKFLFAQPTAVAVVSRVATPFVFGKSNVERGTFRRLPDVDIHGVLLIDGRPV
jgi:hypothetical protein